MNFSDHMTLKSTAAWPAVALILLLAAGCVPAEAPEASQAHGLRGAQEVIPVRTVQVRPASGYREIGISGLLTSEKEARLSFKTGGVLQSIRVKEGDSVKQGALLAALNLTEINAQVDQAQEGLSKTERDLKRVQNLFKEKVATQEQLDNVTTAANVARRALEIAQYNLSYSEIRAPRDGVIVQKLMNEGELAAPGVPVFVFSGAGAGDWVLKCGVSDQNWARIQKGNRAELNFDAFPGVTFFGDVVRLAQGADSLSGLYQVEIRIEPQDRFLALGLFGKGLLRVPSDETGWVLPIDALVEGQGDQALVFVPEGGKALALPVKVLAIGKENVTVSGDLGADRLVIVEGAAYLAEGASIDVVGQRTAD